VNVWTPQHVSSEEKAILEKLNHSENFKPNPNKSDKSFFDRVREAFS
jgi:molecular chaperone DnaJ